MSEQSSNSSTVSLGSDLSPGALASLNRRKPPSATIARAQLLQQYPFLGLDKAARGPTTHDVCDTCAAIEFDNLPLLSEGAIPHLQYGYLIGSAPTCQLCRVILYACEYTRDRVVSDVKDSEEPYLWGSEYTSGPVPEIGAWTRVWLFGAWTSRNSTLPPHYLLGLGTMLACESPTERLFPEHADGSSDESEPWPNASIRICTKVGDPMFDIVPGRVPVSDPGSTSCFEVAGKWTKLCQQSHDCEPKDAPLPPRVISIGEDKVNIKLKLIEANGAVGKYVALSHCWGLGQHTTTTTSNIDQFRHHIPFDDLPKTFRDAIKATAKFGYDYVWIDSLCIIQDSPSDWEIQSMSMADVYANATLTICAAASSSDEEGVFIPRPPAYSPLGQEYGLRDTRSIAIATAAVNVSSGQKSSLSFFPQTIYEWKTLDLDYPLDPIQFDPLCSRAWTFQERILAPRKLLYGLDQLYWECKRCLLSEDGTRGSSSVRLLEQVLNSEVNDVDRLTKGWPSLVAAYSKGELTYAADKLPALAGLAARIGDATKDRYYAGIWGKYLWSDLMWHVSDGVGWTPFGFTFVEDVKALMKERGEELLEEATGDEHPWIEELSKWRNIVTPGCPPPDSAFEVRDRLVDDGPAPSAKSMRHVNYVAPTWSFASVTGRIGYTYSQVVDVVAECVDIRVELDNLNPYSRVKGGSLTLKVGTDRLHNAPSQLTLTTRLLSSL